MPGSLGRGPPSGIHQNLARLDAIDAQDCRTVGRRSGGAPSDLAADADPAIRALARRDLLGEAVPAAAALRSPLVRELLDGLEDRDVPGHPYRKWTGAHWRLVPLVELGDPAGHGPAVRAAEAVLDRWADGARLARVRVVDGRRRMHASQEGDADAVACRLGLAGDERVARLGEHLVAGQWPDGGWNCDPRPDVRRSSPHETLAALWGLHEYANDTGDALRVLRG